MAVLRKTRVMMSQNMNWDLQMYLTVRLFLRFHLVKGVRGEECGQFRDTGH